MWQQTLKPGQIPAGEISRLLEIIHRPGAMLEGENEKLFGLSTCWLTIFKMELSRLLEVKQLPDMSGLIKASKSGLTSGSGPSWARISFLQKSSLTWLSLQGVCGDAADLLHPRDTSCYLPKEADLPLPSAHGWPYQQLQRAGRAAEQGAVTTGGECHGENGDDLEWPWEPLSELLFVCCGGQELVISSTV